jgi:hypothetical protein
MKKVMLIAGMLIAGLASTALAAGPASASICQSQCSNAPKIAIKSPLQSKPTKIAGCSYVCCQWGGATGQVCVRRCMSC